MPEANFKLDDLNGFQLAQASRMIQKELDSVHKNTRWEGECTQCKSFHYCNWLHFAQLEILKKLNGNA